MNFSQFKETSFSVSPHFLLIGNPVGHSLSPLMHNTAAKYYDMAVQYYAVRVESNELSSFASYLNSENLKGVNITIPYKQLMLEYVEELTPACRQIGAVNTVVTKGNRLVGFNTDKYGFCEPLKPYLNKIEDKRVIIFGTGGAALAITFGLMETGVEELLLVSRNPDHAESEKWPERTRIIAYDAWPSYADETSLFVNATPLGMEPHVERSPVKESEISFLADKICYDIIYSPAKTTFLKQAESVKARTIGGLEMLIHQGSRSFELWTGNPFPIELVRDKLKDHLQNGI